MKNYKAIRVRRDIYNKLVASKGNKTITDHASDIIAKGLDKDPVQETLFELKPTGATVVQQLRDVYFKHYGKRYKLPVKDNVALKQLHGKLVDMLTRIEQVPTDEAVVALFDSLLTNLDDWTKQNQFNLAYINSKFHDKFRQALQQREQHNELLKYSKYYTP